MQEEKHMMILADIISKANKKLEDQQVKRVFAIKTSN